MLILEFFPGLEAFNCNFNTQNKKKHDDEKIYAFRDRFFSFP